MPCTIAHCYHNEAANDPRSRDVHPKLPGNHFTTSLPRYLMAQHHNERDNAIA